MYSAHPCVKAQNMNVVSESDRIIIVTTQLKIFQIHSVAIYFNHQTLLFLHMAPISCGVAIESLLCNFDRISNAR